MLHFTTKLFPCEFMQLSINSMSLLWSVFWSLMAVMIYLTDVVGSLECYQCIRSPAINCAHTADYDVMSDFLTTCEPNDDRCQIKSTEFTSGPSHYRLSCVNSNNPGACEDTVSDGDPTITTQNVTCCQNHACNGPPTPADPRYDHSTGGAQNVQAMRTTFVLTLTATILWNML